MSRKKQGGGKRRKALDHDEPFRMCVACRASRPREEMLRFARAPDGGVGFDVRARLPGRGAWTCADPACVEKAIFKGGFARAFEAPVLVADAAAFVAGVRAVLEAEALAGLGLLRKAGALSAGRDEVARAVGAGGVSALVLARDLSARSRAEVTREGVTTVAGPDQAGIGRAVGRKPTGVLAVHGGPRSERLLSDLKKLEKFTTTPLAEAVGEA